MCCPRHPKGPRRQRSRPQAASLLLCCYCRCAAPAVAMQRNAVRPRAGWVGPGLAWRYLEQVRRAPLNTLLPAQRCCWQLRQLCRRLSRPHTSLGLRPARSGWTSARSSAEARALFMSSITWGGVGWGGEGWG